MVSPVRLKGILRQPFTGADGVRRIVGGTLFGARSICATAPRGSTRYTAAMADGRSFFQELKARLRTVPPRSAGKPAHSLKDASVLAPLFWRDGEPWILLTKRPMTLRTHPGQISFPGGGRDEADVTPLHTALRETQEELGIAPADVDVLGILSSMPTITAYYVTPFVGMVPAGLSLSPNAEVAEVLEAPLWRLRREKRVFFHAERDVFVWDDARHAVWGATWNMLDELIQHVGAVGRPADVTPP
jgi:8-oxo-dGTP pyrophosphatase MutT (NUDIX family)